MNYQSDTAKPQSDIETISGAAALSICESMLIALNDHKILNDDQARGILVDAAQTHRDAAPKSTHGHMHLAVAALIEKIMNGENSVRKI